MKKFLAIISCFTIIFSLNNTLFADKVNVTATVGAIDTAPLLSSITPSYSPVVVRGNTIQSFSMQIKDKEGGPISYTITPESGKGSVDITSGSLTNASRLQSGEATIYFKYLAPTSYTGSTKVTVTLNDGTNVTALDIDLYIY
ncbi:MAG: hypothetical protein N4A38_04320 [Candidatus Gracilibacteria bacterium]|nr:hypothetical protein [Candidatus Gracilibacteria bacterium]